MKSSGFNIEDTHMRDMDRIARLVAMVCMALVWAYLVGEHKDINIKPIRILKHGRKAKSLVKYGLEEISTILMRPTYTPKFDVFKFLSCTFAGKWNWFAQIYGIFAYLQRSHQQNRYLCHIFIKTRLKMTPNRRIGEHQRHRRHRLGGHTPAPTACLADAPIHRGGRRGVSLHRRGLTRYPPLRRHPPDAARRASPRRGV